MDVRNDFDSDMVELAQVDIDKLAGLSGSVLQQALRRVRDDAIQPHDALAGFNSAF